MAWACGDFSGLGSRLCFFSPAGLILCFWFFKTAFDRMTITLPCGHEFHSLLSSAHLLCSLAATHLPAHSQGCCCWLRWKVTLAHRSRRVLGNTSLSWDKIWKIQS